jgi:predicted NBD/HSP70 family sugar kinase
MRRDQLEHAIRTACQIIDRSEVIVVGSQAILGTFPEEQLPADATMSIEVDILPIADDNPARRGSTSSPDCCSVGSAGNAGRPLGQQPPGQPLPPPSQQRVLNHRGERSERLPAQCWLRKNSPGRSARLARIVQAPVRGRSQAESKILRQADR